MNQGKQAFTVPVELRRLDTSKLPPTMLCPHCGDIMRAVLHMTFEGSPILYCERCSHNGQIIYYYLAPKGMIV